MSTLLKVLLGIAGTVVALFIALAIAVTMVFDPEDYRPYLVDAVEDATGRSFELEGGIGLALFPCCSAALGTSRLGNPPGFPSDRFASVESTELSLKIWPLLMRREVQIGTVTLQGPDITLTRLGDGRVNWAFADAEPAEPQAPGDESPALAGIDIEAVVIEDGRLRYEDLTTGEAYAISALRLETGRIAWGATPGAEDLALPLEAVFTVSEEGEGTSLNVRLATELSMAGERLTLLSPALDLDGSSAAIPGGQFELAAIAEQILANLGDTPEVSVAGLDATVRALGATATITANGRAGSADAVLEGAFTLEQTSPRELLTALSETAYAPADGAALRNLAASGRWKYSADAAGVEDLDVRLDDSRLTGSLGVKNFDAPETSVDLTLDRLDIDRYLPAPAAATAARAAAPAGTVEPTVLPLADLAELNGNGRVRIGSLRSEGLEAKDVDFRISSRGGKVSTAFTAGIDRGGVELDGEGTVDGANPELRGTLLVRQLSPRALLQALDTPIETRDPDVLERFSGEAQWRLTPVSVALPSLRWQLDDTAITGSLAVDNLDTLASRFDITLDRMNVDAYLAPEDPDAGAAGAQESAAAEAPIPVEAIRALNVAGRVAAGELVMLGMPLERVLAEVTARDGVLRLDPLTAGVYGGQYRGNVTVDATGPTARLSLEQELTAVQVSDVLRTFFDIDVLEGSLSLKLAGTGQGDTPTDILKQLNGDLSFDLSDGVYHGMDVVYELKRARALFRNEPPPATPTEKVTSIRTLAAAGKMANGMLQTNQFTAETAAMTLLGQGGINLMELALDYRFDAQLLAAAASELGLRDLANVTIPLTINGPLSAPKVGVDLKSMVTTTLRDTAQQKARDALLKRLGGTQEKTPSEGATPPGATGDTAAEADTPPSESATPSAAAAADGTAAEPPAEPPPAEPAPAPKPKDLLRQGLRDLLKPKATEPEPEPAPAPN